MPASFFELISFFGVAAFFAWLGFTPLQGQQMIDAVTRNRFKAKENLNRINDYFLVSFLFYSIAAVADYVIHFEQVSLSVKVPLYLLVGVFFFFGIVLLGAPIWFIRRIGMSPSDYLVDIDPPPLGQTLYSSFLAACSTLAALLGVYTVKNVFLQIELVSFLVLSYLGTMWSMQYWRLKGLREIGLLVLIAAPMLLLLLLLSTRRL